MGFNIEEIIVSGKKVQGLSGKNKEGGFSIIITPRGLIGCAILNVGVMEEFGLTGAIAKGTPENPLDDPKNLLGAKLVQVSSKAAKLGIKVGMLGEDVLKIFLAQ